MRRFTGHRRVIVEMNKIRMELEAITLALEILHSYVKKHRAPWQESRLAMLENRACALSEKVSWLRSVVFDGGAVGYNKK